MSGADLDNRVEQALAYPPLVEMGVRQQWELHEALRDARSFEDLAGKWQAAILESEQNGARAAVEGEGAPATSPAPRG